MTVFGGTRHDTYYLSSGNTNFTVTDTGYITGNNGNTAAYAYGFYSPPGPGRGALEGGTAVIINDGKLVGGIGGASYRMKRGMSS